jgi:NAD(P)H dehydrogenase (quinone)
LSVNVAVIYTGDLEAVAEAFGEASGRFGAVRVLRLAGGAQRGHADAGIGDLEWADGIAFGTPGGEGAPAPELMRFIESSRPLWSSGRLYDKVVTVFTDEPERMASDSVLHPVYDALYRWGAVIVGPKAFELEREAQPRRSLAASTTPLPAPRLRSAQYRAVRLARLAGVLAQERARTAWREL